MVAAQNKESTDLRSILNNEKLNGSNFSNWYRNLRIVLRYEDKMRFIEQPLREVPDPNIATETKVNEYYTDVSKEKEVACLMLGAMSQDLQIPFEPMGVYDMMRELKTMFQEQGKVKFFDTAKAFHTCRRDEGQSVSTHFLKMKGYLDTLEHLGYPMPLKLVVVELHAMLNSYKKGLPKKVDTLAVMAIRVGRIQKDHKGKKPQKNAGKTNLAYAPKQKIPPPTKKDNPTKDSECHHYKERKREIEARSFELVRGKWNVCKRRRYWMKRAKHALDSTYLWQCRLGYARKKRIEKLQRDRILNPIDVESFNDK
ncbi:hypothetical protein Tco_0325080, partial [Tanacetum coccineum]